MVLAAMKDADVSKVKSIGLLDQPHQTILACQLIPLSNHDHAGIISYNNNSITIIASASADMGLLL
jgi:hypothetical protein